MIFGLTGQAKAGKDTACRLLQEWGEANGHEFIRGSFAHLLKESAFSIFTNDVEDYEEFANHIKENGSVVLFEDFGLKKPLYGLTGREFLQRYGTEAHRNVFGNNFWVEQFENKYDLTEFSNNKYVHLVITDVRFDNEAHLVHEYGGEVVEITRPDLDSKDKHASESGINPDLVQYEIINYVDETFKDSIEELIDFLPLD